MSLALLAGVIDWTLYIGLCVAGVSLSLVLHELGHVVGACITHSRIFDIVLGSKPRIERWIGGTRLRISWFPIEGYVVSLPRSLKFYRLRRLISVGLGPVFSLAYFGGLVWLSSAVESSRWQSFSSIVTLLLVFELGGLSRVLWPTRVVVAGVETGTDALQLWWTLTKPLPKQQEHERQFAYAEAVSLKERGKSGEVQEAVAKILQTRFAEMPVVERHQWASIFLGLEQWLAAQEAAETILLDPQCRRDDPCRAEAADTFACAALYGNVRDAMPKALGILKDAAADFPEMITLKGSLGGVLFEMRQFDEAEAVLNEVIQKSSANIDHGISTAFLARIAARRGESEEAKRLAHIAWGKAGEMTVVKRVLAELDANGDLILARTIS